MTAKKLSPTPAEIRAKAMDILEQRGVSRSVSAGWYRDFLNRHPLVQRCARTMEQNRAGVSSEAVARYFIELEVLEKAKPCDAVTYGLHFPSCVLICISIEVADIGRGRLVRLPLRPERRDGGGPGRVSPKLLSNFIKRSRACYHFATNGHA